MINIAEIKNGLVIDHIQAGTGWKVFKWLGLDKVNFSTALIMNASSKKTGKKDIIKIDNIINIDYSVLGFIDSNITVNVIQDSKITRKIKMESIRVYTNIQNLVTFTKYTGYDPEVGVNPQDATGYTFGFDLGRYPAPRIISFGLNVSF